MPAETVPAKQVSGEAAMAAPPYSMSVPCGGAPHSYPLTHSQQQSSLSGHSPHPTFQHPAPVCSRRHVSQFGHARLWHGPSGYASLSPACYWLADGLSSQPLKLPSVPADLPTHKGASPDVETFLLQLPPRVLGQSCFLYSFFLSSYLVVQGFFLSFQVSHGLGTVQQELCGDFSICRCVVDVFGS